MHQTTPARFGPLPFFPDVAELSPYSPEPVDMPTGVSTRPTQPGAGPVQGAHSLPDHDRLVAWLAAAELVDVTP